MSYNLKIHEYVKKANSRVPETGIRNQDFSLNSKSQVQTHRKTRVWIHFVWLQGIN